MPRWMHRRAFLRYSAFAAAAIKSAPALAAAPDSTVYLPEVLSEAEVDSLVPPAIPALPSPHLELPRYLVQKPGAQLEDFEDVERWSGDHGTRTANRAQYSTGTQSIRLTTAPSTGFGRMTLALPNLDLSEMERISFWLYLHHPPDRYEYINLRLSSSPSPGERNFTCSMSRSGYFVQGEPLGAPGALHLVSMTRPEFTAVGGEQWENPFTSLALVIQAMPDTPVASASFDNLVLGFSGGQAAVMLSFDDAYTAQYTNCFPYMNARGLRGTVYVISDEVGGGPYMTWDQLREMQAAGWCIANHTSHPDSMLGLDVETQEARIAQCKAALEAEGLVGGNYLAYPWGEFDAATIQAMTNLRIRTGRGVVATRRAVLPPYDLWDIECYNIDSSVSLETAKRLIDVAIEGKTIASLAFHAVGAGDNMSIADFQALIDYIATQAAAGLIAPITIDDYYHLNLTPVRVPLPA